MNHNIYIHYLYNINIHHHIHYLIYLQVKHIHQYIIQHKYIIINNII